MPIVALSPRLFPASNRPLRVEAAGHTSDAVPDDTTARMIERADSVADDPPPAEASEVVDALLDALDDSELAALEELDTEDIEVLARQLHLRGVRRRHPRGFLSVQA